MHGIGAGRQSQVMARSDNPEKQSAYRVSGKRLVLKQYFGAPGRI